ncbi:MAG: hypothetical protein ACLQC7_02870 [Thermoplasmata archaeon]
MAALTAGRKVVLASVILSLVLVVSSSLVAASPLMSHPHAATAAGAHGPNWGPKGPTYSVTFQESGLPDGTNWSVQLVGPSAEWGFFYNDSANTSIGFALPNGTYDFAVASLGRPYVASPASGNVTVNGASATVGVVFTALPLETLTFSETGLPSGAFWSVDLESNTTPPFWNDTFSPLCFGQTYWNGSFTSTVSFVVPNGSYSFAIGNVTQGSALYVPTPSSGNVTVPGSAVTVEISFATVSLFALTFVETGLPNGTFWFADISNDTAGWFFNSSENSTIGFTVPNGTYNFSVGSTFFGSFPTPFCPNGSGNGSNDGGQYVATPASGVVTVDGAGVTVDITFAPIAYQTVNFVETGLPNGTFWSVQLWGFPDGWGWGGHGGGNSSPLCLGTGNWNGSSNSTIGFTVPSGTYDFSIGNVTGNGSLFVPTPAAGNVTLNGSNVTVDVTFSHVALFNLSFVETGLPNGTFWYVQIWNATAGGFFNGSGSSTVSFEVPNGTYSFTVGTPQFYPFPATAAPLCGNGSTYGGGYAATPAAGAVTVNGASVTVDITFAPVTFYTVTFEESGLPSHSFWWVNLDSGYGWAHTGVSALWGGSGNGATGWTWNLTTLEFRLPNGTYNFTVDNVTANGTVYVPTPSSGTVTVSGANVTVSVSFAAGGDPPAGGHPADQGPRAGATVPTLGSSAMIGAGVALLAILLGGILLIWQRRSARSKATVGGTAPQGAPPGTSETSDPASK